MDFFKQFFGLASTSSNVTSSETFQDEQNYIEERHYIEENYLEPDATSEIIDQSGKNMFFRIYFINLNFFITYKLYVF